MSGNHLDQLLETPIYHPGCKEPSHLKDIYETVFLPNVKKETSRSVIIAVVFRSHPVELLRALAEELQKGFSAALAERPGLDVTVAEACVRESSCEIWLKLKSSRQSDSSWQKRVLNDTAHLTAVLEGMIQMHAGLKCDAAAIQVFYEPDFESSYGVAVLFRKDKFQAVAIPSALQRRSFISSRFSMATTNTEE